MADVITKELDLRKMSGGVQCLVSADRNGLCSNSPCQAKA